MENLLDNHDVNHMIWHKACQLEMNHACGPERLDMKGLGDDSSKVWKTLWVG